MRSSPEVPEHMPNGDQLDGIRVRRGSGYLACSLADTGVSSSDDDDLSGQIRDVLLRELRLRNEEVVAEGPCVKEPSEDIESGRVLTHLDNSGVGD